MLNKVVLALALIGAVVPAVANADADPKEACTQKIEEAKKAAEANKEEEAKVAELEKLASEGKFEECANHGQAPAA